MRHSDTLAAVVRAVERDLLLEEEVHRRLSSVRSEGHSARTVSPPDWPDFCAELLAITRTVADEPTRRRLQALCDRFLGPTEAQGSRPGDPTGQVTLSPRESQVLAGVAVGCTNNEIAAHLGLLPNTVKAYLKSAMRKLGAGNRGQAVHFARRSGLIN